MEEYARRCLWENKQWMEELKIVIKNGYQANGGSLVHRESLDKDLDFDLNDNLKQQVYLL